jgi:hypothetical protein
MLDQPIESVKYVILFLVSCKLIPEGCVYVCKIQLSSANSETRSDSLRVLDSKMSRNRLKLNTEF